ncbi:hypothetical protein GPECTOR_53g108 [Gonium pectorale]|uniref:Protein kinase domain-containing protein n=1 Tax=Gonium pectorale TaxID=33097 RepID=A0A150G6Q1_GONPE|nr:hypothetical protein GPECTOR_53g108 [Gonium pectorale]|eukprot:KXZ45522.1 hypothetical protein GPECTOR_53g108 [Gonium pectorale]
MFERERVYGTLVWQVGAREKELQALISIAFSLEQQVAVIAALSPNAKAAAPTTAVPTANGFSQQQQHHHHHHQHGKARSAHPSRSAVVPVTGSHPAKRSDHTSPTSPQPPHSSATHAARLKQLVYDFAVSGSCVGGGDGAGGAGGADGALFDLPTLNPLQPQSGRATLMHHYLGHNPKPPGPGMPSVWHVECGGVNGSGEHQAGSRRRAYVVKVHPCHSIRAQAAWEQASWRPQSTGSGVVADLTPVGVALREGANAAHINDQCASATSTLALSTAVSFPVAAAGSGPAAAASAGWSSRLAPPPPPSSSSSPAWAREPVLPPEAVFVRPCSLVGTQLDAGHDEEVVLVYRHCEGGDAYGWAARVAADAARAAAAGALSLNQAAGQVAVGILRMAFDLLEAVAALHAAGWVHGDIKPENAVVDLERGRGLVLIDTAGAAQLAPASGGWARGAGIFTRDYAAPEQLSGSDPWRGQPSDVYSVGIFVRAVVDEAAESFAQEVLASWRQAQQPWSQASAPREAGSGGGGGASRLPVPGAAAAAAVPSWAADAVAQQARAAVLGAAARVGLEAVFQRCTAWNPCERPGIGQVLEGLRLVVDAIERAR